MTPNNLLVVEDEDAIREMICTLLRREEYSVREAANVEQAMALMDEWIPDLILLDWLLPGLSGIEWTRQLKRNQKFSEIPIIMVTARGEEDDRIHGLELGIDDYVTKPFSTRELIARIQSVLRGSGRLCKTGRIESGGITLNTENHRVTIHGQRVAFTPMEYRLLEFFITHPDKVYSRSQLLNLVWEKSANLDEQTVNIHISRLRKVLSDCGCNDSIQTVRGFGYRFSTRD